jgi:hypothetical protein
MARTGAHRTISDAPRAFVALRLSPDERRLAVWTEKVVAAVWLKDMSRDPLTRLTFSGDDHGPVWRRMAAAVAYESGCAGTHRIFVRDRYLAGEDRQIISADHHHHLNDCRRRRYSTGGQNDIPRSDQDRVSTRGRRNSGDQSFRSAYGVEMTILVVQRLVGEEELSHFAVDGTVDFEMNMRSAHIATSGRIRARLDSCQSVTAVAVGT